MAFFPSESVTRPLITFALQSDMVDFFGGSLFNVSQRRRFFTSVIEEIVFVKRREVV